MLSISHRSTSFKMLSSTMRVGVIRGGNGVTGYGTGFLFDFSGCGDARRLALITNRHVLAAGECNPPKAVVLNYASEDAGHRCSKMLTLTNPKQHIVLHPDRGVDLAALKLDPALVWQLHGVTLDHHVLSARNLPDEERISKMDAIEPVLMVGYPAGTMDVNETLPIARAGITANPYVVDWKDKQGESSSGSLSGPSDFLLDIACFKGSSGSPVFLGNGRGSDLVLLGINKQKRDEKMSTELSGEEALFCEHPIHMAVCVKSREILALNGWLDNPESTHYEPCEATEDDFRRFV